MLIYKALHIIAMVAWFAGLFYLPRLFVYHADANDEISLERFKIMERRLYYGITWPAAITTSLLGFMMIYQNPFFLRQGWMHAKLAFVLLLWVYHLLCGHYLKHFAYETNKKRPVFFRVFNEIPTVFLICIVFLVILKPF